MGRHRPTPLPPPPDPLEGVHALAEATMGPEERERVKAGFQVADWVRQNRLDANVGLVPLAERCGCSASWICAIESGKSLPHPALLSKMAVALGADPFEGQRRLNAEVKRRRLKGHGATPYMTQQDRISYGQSQRLMVLRSITTRLLVYGVSTSADDVGMDLRIAYHTARSYLDDLVSRGDARLVFPEHSRRQWTVTGQGISHALIGDWQPPLEQACDLWPAMIRLFVQRDRDEDRAHEDALKSRRALESRLTLQELADGAPLPPVPGVLRRLRVTDTFPTPPLPPPAAPPQPQPQGHRPRPEPPRHDNDLAFPEIVPPPSLRRS